MNNVLVYLSLFFPLFFPRGGGGGAGVGVGVGGGGTLFSLVAREAELPSIGTWEEILVGGGAGR